MKNRIGMLLGAGMASLLLPAGTALAAGVALPAGQAGVALPALNSAAATSAALPAMPSAALPAMPSVAVANAGRPDAATTLPGLEGLNASAQGSGGGSSRAIRPIRIPGTNVTVAIPPIPGT